eukprot:TRINITY_DN676_c0_g1_i2.p1 TRINITY_DN676_c0_g1~~TRINITY_DN676_c0_g1_i2.p1  ORF type:complete len:106 (+),score=40.29 TRINITY_DN676_c0_g1_i2:33-320(+)
MGELKEFLTAYDNRDTTVGNGFVFGGEHFDVHRFHDNLIYGRRGDAEQGEGIALCRTVTQSNQTVYALITYVYPTLSAKAVSDLVTFCKNHVLPL